MSDVMPGSDLEIMRMRVRIQQIELNISTTRLRIAELLDEKSRLEENFEGYESEKETLLNQIDTLQKVSSNLLKKE